MLGLGILDRYLAGEIAKPFLMLAALLVAILASFDAARALADTSVQGMAVATVLRVVGLKTIIALDVLLPVALYLAVVSSLSRLAHDREVVALRAAGLPESRELRSVLAVALPVALAVGAVSLLARPWAYQRIYTLEARQGAAMDLSDLPPGRFRSNADSGRTLYAKRLGEVAGSRSGFLLYDADGGISNIVLARQARQKPGGHGATKLRLRDGSTYSLDRQGSADRVGYFDNLSLTLQRADTRVGYKRKAASSRALASSSTPDDVAEWQWRQSRPLVALLLAFLGVPLARVAPRESRQGPLLLAVLVFLVYFVAGDMARSWVEQGAVGAVPGIWWTHALLAIGLALLFARRMARRGSGRR